MAWVVFNVCIVAFLILDLFVLHKDKEFRMRDAIFWSIIWVILSFMFAGYIYWDQGALKSLEFITGYLIEKSLSIDNVFVFSIVFQSFQIPTKYQHRVLFYGILGALVMRIIMIFLGVYLIKKFHFLMYFFGAVLIYMAIRLFLKKEPNILDSWIIRKIKCYLPVSDKLHGQSFWHKENGKWCATPLFLALLALETADIIFAIDSIPAIFAITLDPYIVYTSNVFAILGLRSLYFAFAGLINQFYYLNHGLSVMLGFIGIKMLLSDIYKIPTWKSLLVIVMVLAISIGLSVLRARKAKKVSS